jgi:opacity protein-like surface antigen
MKMSRTIMVAVAAFALGATGAHAQRFGVQLDWGNDVDFGVGARVELDVPNLISETEPLNRTFLIGSFDYFFPDCGDLDCTYWEINTNVAFPIIVAGIDPYVGAGLNLAHVDAGTEGGLDAGSDTDVGLNILGGIRFPLRGVTAFGEARYEVAGGEQFVLTFGALIGGVQ